MTASCPTLEFRDFAGCEKHASLRCWAMGRNAGRPESKSDLRAYPKLLPHCNKTESKIALPMESGPPPELHFTYAESLEDVIRRFRSANYYDVFRDHAEQFSEAELREMKQCMRWVGTPDRACKMVLALNIGGLVWNRGEGGLQLWH